MCIECIRYGERIDIDNPAKVKEDDQKFFFTVESTGALPPVEIVRKAMRILKSKIENFSKKLEENVWRSMGYMQ